MDLYVTFDLPAPPAPTIFSRDLGPRRARFPAFDSVTSLSNFLWDLVAWPQPRSAYAMLALQLGYLCLLAAGLPLFVAVKIRRRAWWLFHFKTQRRGQVIVPHIHNVWTMCVALFGILYIMTCTSLLVALKQRRPLPHRGIIFTQLWVPLYFSAIYQTWAILHANGGSSGPDSARCRRGKARLPAWAINAFALLLPIAIALGGLAPGILSDRCFEQARRGWQQWTIDYQEATSLSRPMLLDAQNIWTNELRAAFFMTLAYIYNLVVLVIFGTAQIISAWQLIKRLNRHLRQQAMPRLGRLRPAPGGGVSFALRPVATTTPSSDATHVKTDAHIDIPAPVDRADAVPLKWAQTEEPIDEERAQAEDEGSGSELTSHIFVLEETRQDQSFSFFPPVKPSRMVNKLGRDRASQVLLLFTLQTLSVTIAASVFLCNCIFIIVATYPAIERGRPQDVDTPAWHVLSTLVCVAGTMTAISAVHPTYEDSFSALTSGAKPARRVGVSIRSSVPMPAPTSDTTGPPTPAAQTVDERFTRRVIRPLPSL